MANIFPAFIQVHPSYTMPEFILPYTQNSGAFDLIAGGAPMGNLPTSAQYVYAKRLDVRTKVAAGQQPYESLPSCTVAAEMFSTPAYLMRVRAEWNHHDVAAAGNWGVSLPQAQSLAMRQAHNQQKRNALLYGFNPLFGEGLVNTAGATAVSLPPDSYGNQTASTYDNGQMSLFLGQQILAVKGRMFQLGMPTRVAIVGPQRILGQFEYNIVQLTSAQRPGGGTGSTRMVFEDILKAAGDKMTWNYDDTLIGQGAGGTDLVIITCPEISKPPTDGTNAFAGLMPGYDITAIQMQDRPAPTEITAPLPGGAVDVLSEMRITSGWGIRPEAIQLISIAP